MHFPIHLVKCYAWSWLYLGSAFWKFPPIFFVLINTKDKYLISLPCFGIHHQGATITHEIYKWHMHFHMIDVLILEFSIKSTWFRFIRNTMIYCEHKNSNSCGMALSWWDACHWHGPMSSLISKGIPSISLIRGPTWSSIMCKQQCYLIIYIILYF